MVERRDHVELSYTIWLVSVYILSQYKTNSGPAAEAHLGLYVKLPPPSPNSLLSRLVVVFFDY